MLDILHDNKKPTSFYLIGVKINSDATIESEVTFVEAWKIAEQMDLYDTDGNKRYRVQVPEMILCQKYTALYMLGKVDVVFKTKGVKMPILIDYFL